MKLAAFFVAACAFACVATCESTATAQSRSETDDLERMRPPVGAIEITTRASLVQGFGVLSSEHQSSDQLGGWGYGAMASIAYRAYDAMAFGAGFAFEQLGAMRDEPARSVAARLEATRHFDPSRSTDPWMTLGTGYRWLWTPTFGTTPALFAHGFEIASLRVGIDLRRTMHFAFAPVGGVDLQVFNWQRWGDGPVAASDHPRVTALLTLGVQGRFDVGGAD